MSKPGVAWNKGRTASVVLSKLKEFTITETSPGIYALRGWFNSENSFFFGEFKEHEAAEDFLEKIHQMF